MGILTESNLGKIGESPNEENRLIIDNVYLVGEFHSYFPSFISIKPVPYFIDFVAKPWPRSQI